MNLFFFPKMIEYSTFEELFQLFVPENIHGYSIDEQHISDYLNLITNPSKGLRLIMRKKYLINISRYKFVHNNTRFYYFIEFKRATPLIISEIKSTCGALEMYYIAESENHKHFYKHNTESEFLVGLHGYDRLRIAFALKSPKNIELKYSLYYITEKQVIDSINLKTKQTKYSEFFIPEPISGNFQNV